MTEDQRREIKTAIAAQMPFDHWGNVSAATHMAAVRAAQEKAIAEAEAGKRKRVKTKQDNQTRDKKEITT